MGRDRGVSQREETEGKRQRWRDRGEEAEAERQNGEIEEERHTRDG